MARCTVTYEGRLQAHLASAVRLLMLKADGSISVHCDDGAYKPLNWMGAPNVFCEAGDTWTFRNARGERLVIRLEEVIDDRSFDLGEDPGLRKLGVESELQSLLAAQPSMIEDGLALVRREHHTDLGPVDLLCRDVAGRPVAVEVKRIGEIDGVEQLSRYLERLRLDPWFRDVRGILVATSFRPQAKVLAAERGIDCVTVDFEILRSGDVDQPRLF
ncbi:MAG: endonuclease NucS [Acidimicrobiales bacterium]|nr:MAG: endonuclease NucS [Acidimicrobiales bacterium]